MKKFIEEFKKFAFRGNIVDMSIGVLIGGAFSGLVASFTTDIINPILAILGNPANGLGWVIPLPGASEGILIGDFIGAVINFIIMAFVIFTIMKVLNKIATMGQKEEETVEQAPVKDPQIELLEEIRDLLKENK
ncbi:large conductance mechanosensitive channel protein MscL [Floccifex sp.]|uniref:large conductance mechanosensitive channel protein MscL n=1 Tax=Floccifex sp. TaxID=2815810 RepID=UPI002A762E62|nr:large conductance mechanosensitive channel protein MscL [Floccifex sp.]MDD7280882.1 large conductance mechanosensitive channel protein MscL [Erysipelotrichaceae bacterium]MDY2958043.1 large conductance mechanosensitive channel protein MscL [Floccifex sp.]